MQENTLKIAQIVDNTEAEGPGKRFAVWVQGCPLRCPGCCNPHMLVDRGGVVTTVTELQQRIANTPDIQGISWLGGEPFSQPGPVAEVSRWAQQRGLDTMVYSGFTLEDLKAKQDPNVDALLSSTDLLVDGPFERENPESLRRWVGSTNQGLRFLTSAFDPLDPQFTAPNTLELRLENGRLTINGWPGLDIRFRRK